MPNKADILRSNPGSNFSISFGLAAAVFFFVGSGIISYRNMQILNEDVRLVTHTHEVILALEDLLTLTKDAETGQRGFVITGEDRYLEPYTMATEHVKEQLNKIATLTKDNPAQQLRLPTVRSHITAKLRELAETIDLRRKKGFEAAHAVVISDRGKGAMDNIRNQIAMMQQEERTLRAKRFNEMKEAYWVAVISGIGSGLLGVVLSFIVSYLIKRGAKTRLRQEWLQSGQVGLSTAMFGDQRMEQLGDNVLKFMAEYVKAQAGAFFVLESNGFRRIATYGAAAETVPEHFDQNDGLIGQAAKDKKTFLIKDIPDGYLTIGSAFGKTMPKHLLITPAISNGIVNAVLELGFLEELDERTLELMERAAEMVGVAVRSANYRKHLQNLLEETQQQAEELQTQSEELRVNNEELEEQSRALKESQSRLEQQQAELEQTNSQLEEQAQQLEIQRDDLAQAQVSVQMKADELELASRYKSDFLANMSHELRTPLNSSLILAKLLADNPAGNLSEEQVKFAKTIQSSGNDLLVLIEDILDLSKIEAGHMQLVPEPVALKHLINDMNHMFEPFAKQKKIGFKADLAADCPDEIETDSQRLKQVLKNLLSNAMKFTEKGQVEMTVTRETGGHIAFAVKDTGIGIAPDQQAAIFEAFRQADGTISRKYGGTGLGLSISRELARLLGGDIELQSEIGKGSIFTVTIPVRFQTDNPLKKVASKSVAMSAPPASMPKATSKQEIILAKDTRRVPDDRDDLTPSGRTILIIEDDESFARILYELAHELNFQCLVATTAEEAVSVIKQYMPNAVVLDVGLPDHSGLFVLDQLKRDKRTRHIPVHVISGSDYTQTALSLGASGYMLKPVKREALVETLKSLETKFAQRMRRVLIVEDDPVQQDSMRKLLGSHDVQTVGVGTASECLAQLKETTFDCMVLDLSLPDASGYSLLETLSKEEAYSFPPVIVYTGKDLSMKEEQDLRRYSKSIIIKGAKSPERLLDEVTLFLHQVVSDLPPEQQRMLEKAKNRDSVLEGRRILIVEDDVRNIYAVTSIFEPIGAIVSIARNGLEALDILEKSAKNPEKAIDLVLMDFMMPEMDGLTATREIRKNPAWKKLPIIMLTAKAMKDDQERCLEAGANDYMAKPLDVEKLLSLVRVWMPR